MNNNEAALTIEIEKSFNLKRNFFDGGHTRSYEFRIEQLKKLKEMIKKK